MPMRYWDRILKGLLLSPPPPCHPDRAQGFLQARPPSGLGLGRAHPQPPACAQASCLGAAAQGSLPRLAGSRVPHGGGGRACISPRAHVFSSPSVPWSPQTQNHTLPALIYSADHPSTFKQDPNRAGRTTPLTHSGGPTKHVAPGQLKPPATQAGRPGLWLTPWWRSRRRSLHLRKAFETTWN